MTDLPFFTTVCLQWQVSPTMLAPLLFGGTMLFRSIYTNASIIFPRIGVTAMVLWVLWSANGILQSAVYNLRMQASCKTPPPPPGPFLPSYPRTILFQSVMALVPFFLLFCFVSSRYVSFRLVSSRFVLFCFVSFCFFSFRFVSLRFVLLFCSLLVCFIF